MSKKRIRWGILGLVLGLAVAFPAGGKLKAAMTVVEVKKTGQVVDEFQGVNAVYRPGKWDGNDKTYSCAALVKKYYQARYGFTPYNLFSGATPEEYEKGGKFKRFLHQRWEISHRQAHTGLLFRMFPETMSHCLSRTGSGRKKAGPMPRRTESYQRVR